MQPTSLKITSGVTAVLLLLCLFDMPYGYYTLIRYVGMIVFGVLALFYIMSEHTEIGLVCAAIAVLFQPFVKFALGRTMWNVVDVLCAIVLIGLIVYEKFNKKEE